LFLPKILTFNSSTKDLKEFNSNDYQLSLFLVFGLKVKLNILAEWRK